ncbi:hypothetical protein CMQ_7410 [Grosmannia clavigera kw1407]|uniref:Uncharacterized protein n=1 Tax=Grosmannia clavigera (strain kw1407 / UAMH 11150) TaxID=655863 RepID=F0XPH6_GROCL|nr:uncharacterized protein CMQ_7410 [Grosmannia clavigera kw1407]EFX00408.1 hypothetical protein CMQ_7410 [Grosmannia clavigera kw1407]
MLVKVFVAAITLVSAVTGSCAAPPPAPTLSFLYSLNLTNGAEYAIGATPQGFRTVQPIVGGAFSGPKMKGNVTTGIDYGVVDSNNTFHPKAVYVLETVEGDTILVTESGRAPNINVIFDTASTKYGWLNKAVGYATGGLVDGVVSLNVWQITPPS